MPVYGRSDDINQASVSPDSAFRELHMSWGVGSTPRQPHRGAATGGRAEAGHRPGRGAGQGAGRGPAQAGQRHTLRPGLPPTLHLGIKHRTTGVSKLREEWEKSSAA